MDITSLIILSHTLSLARSLSSSLAEVHFSATIGSNCDHTAGTPVVNTHTPTPTRPRTLQIFWKKYLQEIFWNSLVTIQRKGEG